MAKQRIVNTEFWDDEYIQSLEPAGKLLFIYLFTNSRTTIAGAYQTTLGHIRFHTGLTEIEIEAWMDKFTVDGKAEFHDGWCVMLNTIKHQTTSNAKIAKGIEEAVNGCPGWVKDRLSIAYQGTSHLNLNSNLNSNLNKNGVAVATVAAGAAVYRSGPGRDPWEKGIDLLKQQGMTEAQVRPFLGRLAKQYSAAEMHTAIEATAAEKPADARAFLIAVLRTRAERPKRRDVRTHDPASAAETWACGECFDTGEVSVAVPENKRKFVGEIAWTVCPACKGGGG